MQPVRASLGAISRRSRPRPIGLVLLAHAVAALAGCAQMNPTRTGYLTDYSHLQVTERRIPLVRPRVVESGCPGAEALKEVESFYIEPIGWAAGEAAPGSFEEACGESLSDTLRASLARELGALKPVVDWPGARTARVRAAVTRVAYARPLLNSALTVVAVPVFNGGGVVEAEVVAPDGRQIAALVAALPGGAFDVMGFYTWDGHAEKAMRRSACRLRKLLASPPAPTRPPSPALAGHCTFSHPTHRLSPAAGTLLALSGSLREGGSGEGCGRETTAAPGETVPGPRR